MDLCSNGNLRAAAREGGDWDSEGLGSVPGSGSGSELLHELEQVPSLCQAGELLSRGRHLGEGKL